MSQPTTTDAEVLERQREPGWLFPYLVAVDLMGWLEPEAPDQPERTGPWRWAYWLWIIEHEALPPEKIPQLSFQPYPDRRDAKTVQDWLKIPVSRYGWWYDEAWRHLVRWLLFGFGRADLADDLERIPETVKAQWYRQVDLSVLLRTPCDWSAFILQGGLQADKSQRSPWADTTGFYATPMNVCQMMTAMTFGPSDDPLTDHRLETVLDPCCGTGSMLLAASNHSLRLFGQDIVLDLCLCSELNGWLWMPWMVFQPEPISQMLSQRYNELARLRAFRRIFNQGPVIDVKLEESPAPAGVQISDSPETRAMAEERRRSAEAFRKAAREGTLEQASLF